MPNFKAEYTLEMVLDLIEADLHKEGFDLDNTPITFHLNELDRASLILDVVKADRNAIPSFLSTLLPETQQALLGPAPAIAPAREPENDLAKNGKPYKRPPSEKELARRAKISGIMKKRRADERAAKEAKSAKLPDQVVLQEFPTSAHAIIDSVPVLATVQDPTPTPEPAPQAALRDQADYLVPQDNHTYKEPPAALLALHSQLFEKHPSQPSEGTEVVAPAVSTFPGSRQ